MEGQGPRQNTVNKTMSFQRNRIDWEWGYKESLIKPNQNLEDIET